MNIFSAYKVKIKHYNKIFEDTVKIYREAVSFFIDICDKEWSILEPLKNLERCREIEKLAILAIFVPVRIYILFLYSVGMTFLSSCSFGFFPDGFSFQFFRFD